MVNKVWLSGYPSDVLPEISYDEQLTLVDVFEESVQRYAHQVAFINMDKSMTFKELDAQSRAFAAYLMQELNLQKGDRIALMMPNLLQYPIALFGALRAGLIVVNVNPLYTATELEHQLKDCGAKAIVILANFANTLEKVIKATQVEHVILTSLGDQIS